MRGLIPTDLTLSLDPTLTLGLTLAWGLVQDIHMLSRSIGSQCLDMGLLAEPVLAGGKDLVLIAATARHQDLSREVSSPVCQWFPGGQGHLQEPAEGHRYLYRVEGVGHPLSADTEGTGRGTGPLLVLVRVAGLVHLPLAAL